MSEIETESLTSAASTERREKKVIFDKYEIGRLLGCGGFAKVYYARDIRTGHSVAVKAVNKTRVEKSNLIHGLKREITVMRLLRHPHIIRLIEVLATKTKVYFIMEFAKGGELFAKVAKGRFSEDLSRRYFHQLISAVGYCHSRGVYHRDLKPENILLDENWNLKISDFGLSAVKEQMKSNSDGMLHTLCGTPAYVAPEVLAKKGYFGNKVDIWSCGIILFVLTAGFLPFNDTNLMNLYRKIYKGEFRCPRWMSNDLRNLLHRLLEVNPDNRITIDEIINDPWFKKGGYIEVNIKFYDEDYMKKDDVDNVDDDEINGGNNNIVDGNNGNLRFLNAFDLISFSPGINLSGLFMERKGGNCCEMFLSGEEPEKVVEFMEKAAREVDVPKVVVERVKRGMGVRLEGQNGDFGLTVAVHRLTEELVVVEVVLKKRDNDVGISQEFWKEKLRPKISHLIYDPNQVGVGPSNINLGSSNQNSGSLPGLSLCTGGVN